MHVLFGPLNRYKITKVTTRFNVTCYFVQDAECPDELDLPSVIRQSPTIQEAIEGLVEDVEQTTRYIADRIIYPVYGCECDYCCAARRR